MSNQFTMYLTAPVVIPRLQHVGGGDSDVFTKGGRWTGVSVVTLRPQVPATLDSVSIIIQYDVRERRKNHTHLSGTTTVRFHADSGYRILQVGPGGVDAHYYEEWPGQNHQWNDISHAPGIAGSYFRTLDIRFDGEGDDDQGNAGLRGLMEVPVTVELEQVRSTLPFSEIRKAIRMSVEVMPRDNGATPEWRRVADIESASETIRRLAAEPLGVAPEAVGTRLCYDKETEAQVIEVLLPGQAGTALPGRLVAPAGRSPVMIGNGGAMQSPTAQPLRAVASDVADACSPAQA